MNPLSADIQQELKKKNSCTHTMNLTQLQISASHVTKTRHAHQVTAASLYTLLQQAYSEDVMSSDTDTMQPDVPPFEESVLKPMSTLITGLGAVIGAKHSK